MSYLSQLQLDILTVSILFYIKPKQLDVYCCCDNIMFQWFQNVKNVEFYIKLRGQHQYLKDHDSGIAWAAKKGSQLLVNYFVSIIEEGDYHGIVGYNPKLAYNPAMAAAAQKGHSHIVNQMLSLGATDYNMTMAFAARENRQDILNQMLVLGQLQPLFDYNWTMVEAAGGGHIEIIKLMLTLGADNYNQTMAAAAEKGYLNIINLMLNEAQLKDSRGNRAESIDCNRSLIFAAKGGHQKIVDMMLALGADDYDGAMAYAADGGHIKIIQLMLDLGATDYDRAMAYAAGRGHIKIVQLMLDLGATDYDRAMTYAKEDKQIEIVTLLKKYLAKLF